MRHVMIRRFGGPEVLQLTEAVDPAPGPDEVVVRLRASGVNFSDVASRQGLNDALPKPPLTLGYEGAGVVDAVGPSGPAQLLGKRVLAVMHHGAYADRVCLPAAQVVALPEAVTFEQAAALPINYLTAYRMLFRLFSLRKGSTVLLHGAAGGVGLAVAQLTRLVDGVSVIGTAAPGKHAVARANGCHHLIDPKTEDYVTEVRRLTGGAGVDLVLDPLGGAEWRRGYQLLKPEGMLIAFGFSRALAGDRVSWARLGWEFLRVPRFSPLTMLDQSRAVAGFNLGAFWRDMPRVADELRQLLGWVETGAIAPHVHQVFALEDAASAHRCLQERRNVGKILLAA